jgi:hypothetical protein
MSRKIFPDFPQNIQKTNVPAVIFEEVNGKLNIESKSQGIVDDDINFGEISKTIRTWFDENYVMTLKTYGGRPTYVKGKGSTSDLSCLYYSVIKAISPDVQNGSNPFQSESEHFAERSKLIHNLKRSMIEYLFTDTNCLNNSRISEEIKQEKMNAILTKFVIDPDLSDEENYIKILEIQIKLKYTIFVDQSIRKKFYNRIEENFMKTEEDKSKFLKRLKKAIDARNLLINEINSLKMIFSKLDEKQIGKYESLKLELLNPELLYNKIVKSFYPFLEDPRFHTYKNEDLKLSADDPLQYAFPQEIRNLPLTYGIFNIPIILEKSESELRTAEFGKEQNQQNTTIPLDGKYKTETIMDELLSPKMNGLFSLEFMCQVFGYNIYLINSEGNPQDFAFSYGPSNKNVDLLQMIYNFAIKNNWEQFDFVDNPDNEELFDTLNPEAPCCVIKYTIGHFESISVFHKIDISHLNLDKKEIFQEQSIFSYYDPFIQAFRDKFIKDRQESIEKTRQEKEEIEKKEREKEKKEREREKEKKEREKEKEKEISLIKKFNKSQIQKSPIYKKAVAELVEEGVIDSEEMTPDDQFELINTLALSLDGITVEKYIEQKAEEHDSRNNTPVKKDKNRPILSEKQEEDQSLRNPSPKPRSIKLSKSKEEEEEYDEYDPDFTPDDDDDQDFTPDDDDE